MIQENFSQDIFDEAYIRAQKQVAIAMNVNDPREYEQKIEDAHIGNISEMLFNEHCKNKLKTSFIWTGENIEDNEAIFASSDFIIHQFDGDLKINIKSSIYNDNPIRGSLVTTLRFNLPCSLAVKLESNLYLYTLVDMDKKIIYWMAMISGNKLKDIRNSYRDDEQCKYENILQGYAFRRRAKYILVSPEHADYNAKMHEFLTNTNLS